ncbi:MAG: hypothetical protein IJ151_08550 [Bacteroidales bacterium]|nr:hypothetical protein [Bacteroidales bacterium]
MTKTLEIPFIPSLETLDFQELDLTLEENGAKACIGCVNWSESFPYRPDCNLTAAHDGKSLALLFHVRGLDLRGMETEDNGRMWEDSCVEFFVQDPAGDKYYNFELTCTGRLLAAMGPDRHDRARRDSSVLGRIRRYTSVEQESPFQIDGGIHSWTAGMLIPLDVFGADGGVKTLRGNFYKCGDKTAHMHFVSWSPIELPKPDFHRPDFFGNIVLK